LDLASGSEAVMREVLAQFNRAAILVVMLAAILVFALSACGSSIDEKGEFLDFADHPLGAVVPVGLDRVEFGMRQREVLQTLGTHHKVIHSAVANSNVGPIADFFKYSESGRAKWAEIHYTEDGRVHAIYFGYEELHGLE
jgi:hypothetical protein